MTAVLPPTSSSSPQNSPSPINSPSPNPNHPALPPLITPNSRRSTLPRPSSFASKSRLSTYSNTSIPSLRSRPVSHVFPLFHSSLPYAAVRDFAYPAIHPLHYGPQPEPSASASGLSTPASEHQRRLSDPLKSSWEQTGWAGGPWADTREQLPPITFGDGPPWSEDEDLQSPVVVSSRHRKHKSSSASLGGRRGRSRGRGPMDQGNQQQNVVDFNRDRGVYTGTNHDGSEIYYVSQGNEANGPGGEYVTYPPDQARHATLAPYNVPGQRDSHFATLLPNRSYEDQDDLGELSDSSTSSSPGMTRDDESRYSRDYQFTIASPDEEMHGKAVALFDFERENENELPLVEGQIIWVSYRHGQGWLVAEDPKTRESGLVPEAYVRLLRDIQGGLTSLTGDLADPLISPGAPDTGTPTQAEYQGFGNPTHTSNGFQHPPVVSTFSTSSQDLHPYPQHLLGTHPGQQPPQVVHYHGQRGGSQSETPTLTSLSQDHMMLVDKHNSQDFRRSGQAPHSSEQTPVASTAPTAAFDANSKSMDDPTLADSDTVMKDADDTVSAR